MGKMKNEAESEGMGGRRNMRMQSLQAGVRANCV